MQNNLMFCKIFMASLWGSLEFNHYPVCLHYLRFQHCTKQVQQNSLFCFRLFKMKNSNLLRAHALFLDEQDEVNMNCGHCHSTLNNAHSARSNMVVFYFSFQLQRGPVHRQNKHYPLWRSWPSAPWMNGTSSCFPCPL